MPPSSSFEGGDFDFLAVDFCFRVPHGPKLHVGIFPSAVLPLQTYNSGKASTRFSQPAKYFGYLCPKLS